MKVLGLQSFFFTLTLVILVIKEQDAAKEHRNYHRQKVSQDTNLLQCLPDFFNSLFTLTSNPYYGEPDAERVTIILHENSQCVAQSLNCSEKLVKSFGRFFDSLFPCNLKGLNERCEDKQKEKLKIYQNAIYIAKEISKNKKIFSRLKSIVTKFLEKMKVPNPSKPDDEVSQFLSRNLLDSLSYHFNATYEFSLPAGIKEQDKLLQRNLFWTSGFIAITAAKSKTMFIYIAKVFNIVFNVLTPGIITTNRHRQKKLFYNVLDQIKGELGVTISANATFTGSRIIFEFVESMEDPEPNYPDVEIVRANFDGIPVIIQNPTDSTPDLRPGLVFFHGGGWVYRRPDKYLQETVYLAQQLGAVVVSVDYKRSPKYKYPIPLENCLNVTKYFMKNAHKYYVDDQRIGIIGDGAGGNMAASISLHMRDYQLQKPKLQVLLYPFLQMFYFDLPSYQQNKMIFGVDYKEIHIEFYLTYTNLNHSILEAVYNNKHICKAMKTSTQNSYFDYNVIPAEYRKNYTRHKTSCDLSLAETVKKTMLNPYIFPFMAKSLKNLPPTLMINGEFDILRDEGLMFGSRLRKDNVPLEEHLINGGYHDMLIMLDFKTSDVVYEVMGIIVNYLKNNL